MGCLMRNETLLAAAKDLGREGPGRIVVRFEQAVYGSFPFWDKGYGVLATSPGVRPEWLAEFQAVCQRYGEPPRGVSGEGAMFAQTLTCGPWLIVGVCPQGHDDRGRPGALAFHGLFVSAQEYRKVQFDPFRLSGALGREWDGTMSALPHGGFQLPANEAQANVHSDLSRRVLATLTAGRSVALEAFEPIEAVAREVWAQLPESVRRRASVATLAFSNANRFDLVAFPRLASVTLDPKYATVETLLPPVDLTPVRPRSKRRRRIGVALASFVLLSSVALAYVALRERGPEPRVAPTAALESASNAPRELPPVRANYLSSKTDADERWRVVEALIDFAERFGVASEAGFDLQTDPADVIDLLADRLRYRGTLLSDTERAALGAIADSEATRALTWDRHVRHFVPDRPLPPDFAQGPLRWQLDTLAWSFHTPPDPGVSPAEAPHALGDALAFDGPLRPNPFTERFPALAEYERFLARLPRR